MDIGTAKPTPAERGGVPHHLIDVLDVRETATVAEFQQRARNAIADCQGRGVVSVLVGGSALYVRAIVDDFRFPGTDPALRAELEGELAAVGPEALHRRLAKLDPASAAQILPGNGRRVVRALEVIGLTGDRFSADLPPRHYALAGVVQVGLDIDRHRLDQRIAERVDRMWADGLVDEVRRLAETGLREGLTASRALGYRQVLAYLDGETTEDEARTRTVAATRRFARRQDSWFRKDPRIVWLPFDRAGPGRRPWSRSWRRRRRTGCQTEPMRRWSFSKGHGTENDFVLLLDREAMLDIGPAEVRYLCDRRAGVGGDGLLRAVLAKHVDGWDGDGSLWFMDYRNADGSIAEMCGNGARVFARFLADEGLVSGPTVSIATRSGLRETTLLPDGRVRVSMGPVRWARPGSGSASLAATVLGRGDRVSVGNPHAVSFIDDLDALDLTVAPRWAPAGGVPRRREPGVRPGVRTGAPGDAGLRARGGGDAVLRHRHGGRGRRGPFASRTGSADGPVTYRVDVPGGTVEVELADGEASLVGPAVLVAHGEVSVPGSGPGKE